MLQLCPTLCDPIDDSPPGLPVPGILQARTLEWVAISVSSAWKWKVKVKLISRIRLSDPKDCSLPGSCIHGIFQARVLEWITIAFSTGYIKNCNLSMQMTDLFEDPSKTYLLGRHCLFCLFYMKSNFQSVQLLSHVRLFASTLTAVQQASLSITNSRSLPKLMSFESVLPSNHLIFCCPLLLLPSIFPSITVFSNESALSIRWPKYWSFSFNISPSSEHPGLISFRMDWLDLLVVQGTLKSLLQHHSSKASMLQCSVFFVVQLSQPYMTTGKTRALTRWALLAK